MTSSTMEVEEETKKMYLWKAKLAQEANRFEDMAMYMRQVFETGAPMSKDEDNMLAAAYKHLLDTKRTSRRSLITVEHMDTVAPLEATMARDYRERVESEVLALCTEMLTVISGWLESPRAQSSDPESHVFYRKLYADYKRYAAEVTTDSLDRAAVITESRVAYERAEQLGRDSLRPIDPIRLGLMLNYSVFLYQMCDQHRQGHDLAKEAYEEAVAEIDSIDDHVYDESMLILRLIRDNLAIWVKENGGRPFEDPVVVDQSTELMTVPEDDAVTLYEEDPIPSNVDRH
ncbi:14-3-3 protein zeta/delta-like [Sipha flava]|uniref:14-3-3 protein zeta/delta n=1 Tax=Sipha flava TaxID=143950 RepID=A0A2S2PUT8_9HEMI|nr:14-3-3 protein zeta/delta-like [Sipha flava]